MNYKVVELESKNREKVELTIVVSIKTPSYLDSDNREVRFITKSSQGRITRYTDLKALSDSADTTYFNFNSGWSTLDNGECKITDFKDELDYLVKEYIQCNLGVFEELRV